MDRFPNLRAVINAQFGSVYKFCQATGLPQSTVKMLILGKLNTVAEVNARRKVDDALRRLQPDLNMNGVWARQDPQEKNNLVVEVPPGTKAVEIHFTVSISFQK